MSAKKLELLEPIPNPTNTTIYLYSELILCDISLTISEKHLLKKYSSVSQTHTLKGKTSEEELSTRSS